ncbi:DUF6773 family protein [Proteinivorax hydrogeniformans]|uniref:DUF6773 family protein n=1 Tax=Proteinivorax hydrogeniformans TaxID=1826727 RepID=A0AAU8HVE3_9FIRM
MKEFFKESNDERIELISKDVGRIGFYILLLTLVISNVIKAFVLELDRQYWLDTHIIILAVGGILLVLAMYSGLSYSITDLPKTERKKSKIKYSVLFALGTLYQALTTGGVRISDGAASIIGELIVVAVYFVVFYGILTFLFSKKEKKEKNS